MFIRRALSFALAVLWLWPTSLHAQSEVLLEANRQGKALFEAGAANDKRARHHPNR